MELLRELYFFNDQFVSLNKQLTLIKERFEEVSDKIKQLPVNEVTDLNFSKNNMTLPNLKLNIDKLHDMLEKAFRSFETVGKLRDEQGRNRHAQAIKDNIKRIDARLKTLEDEYHYYVSQTVGDIFDRKEAMPSAPSQPAVNS